MRIRTHILLFQAIVAFSVASLAVVAYVNIRSGAYTVDRLHWANQELQAMTQLAVFANRYSEQIAEVLLIGEPELPDFESARADVRRTFVHLRRIIHEEIAFLTDPAEKEQERRELTRLGVMETVFNEVERAAERVLRLSHEGRQQEAVALFRSDIENRLDAEFERLIAEAVVGERDEVVRTEADADRRSFRLIVSTVSSSALLIVLTLGAGVYFARSLFRPMTALAEGALAIGRGELSHRIGFQGDSELGLISRRFNQMAEELSRQRDDLLAARNNLERQVEQRTQELADSNRRLTQVDELRARFLTDASHELRTPLTVLRGEAEVALRGASKPEESYRQALKCIIEQAADMGRLVDDLLFLARSEANEIRFERREVGLRDIVSDAVREAAVLGRGRDIAITLHQSEYDFQILADPHRLRQALLIVLDNAVRYSRPGTEVQVGVHAGTDVAAEVIVQDDGPGISEEDLPRVFQRFYRGHNARTQAPGGSGLGLSIALWIVEKHGGTIQPSSSANQGTIMRIRLPVAD